MPSFRSALLTYTRKYESSTAFWKWASYAAIAGVLRDNCYRRIGEDRLYPNVYILLLADSGVHRKGKPIRLANKLVRDIGGAKIIAGRTSVQAIFEEMIHTETDPITGKMPKGGSAIFFAEELAGAIVQDDAAIGILTDIYDYRTDFKLNLVGKGRRKIESMVFSLFAGSNEDLLKGVYTTAAIHGGLLARTFLVMPDEFRKSNSLMEEEDMPCEKEYEVMFDSLRKIVDIKGEFKVESCAMQEFKAWYKPFRDSQMKKKDRTGVLGRIHTSVEKLSMLFAADSLTLTIKKEHVEEAIMECLTILPNYNTFSMAQGKSDIAEAGGLFLQELLNTESHSARKSVIMRKYWSDIDLETLEKLVTNLEAAGLIKIIIAGNDIAYKLTEECLKKMKGADL